jgi:hypothetical protein
MRAVGQQVKALNAEANIPSLTVRAMAVEQSSR